LFVDNITLRYRSDPRREPTARSDFLMRDPYDILGVAKDADIKEIKKAYRKLARQHHPDLHPGDRASEDRFKEVSSAYDFLSDPDRKAKYDRGEIDAAGSPKAQRRFYRDFAEAAGGERYADPSASFHAFEDIDILSEMFRGARRDRRHQRGADLSERIEVDFLDAVNGAERELVLPTGKHVKMRIPAGAVDGQVMRLKGQGLPGPGGGSSGDLLLELSIRPHPKFTRAGNDIVSELPITLSEAVLGGRVEVATVDGSVNLTIPKGSNTGTRLRVRGKGALLADGHRGDHYVTLKVVLPNPPDDDLVRLVEGWAPSHPYRVRD
jgi:DnaJ-class molecular chaperone